MTQDIQLKNGQVLVSVTGYSGEEDFYLMFDIIKELLNPEHATYGVDSMCVDGSFRKDGLLVRMSSECVTMSPEDVAKVRGWIDAVVVELHARRPK